MNQKNFTDTGVYYRIKKHVVLYWSDFDENNNVNFCTYIKRPYKTEHCINGFDKIKIIEGVCDFDKEQFIINIVNKQNCKSEDEFNYIYENTKKILHKEVMYNI